MKDKWESAKFLADILNLEAGPEWDHFAPVKTANGVTLAAVVCTRPLDRHLEDT